MPVALSISYLTVSVGTISMYAVTTAGASGAEFDAVPGMGAEGGRKDRRHNVSIAVSGGLGGAEFSSGF